VYADLFRRHLDLGPLGGRAEGKILCIFHGEKTPSLNVDVVRGLWHCFGCGVGGGVKDFAARVGERAPGHTAPTWRNPLERGRDAVLARERRAAAKRAPWAPVMAEAARYGDSMRQVDAVRKLATQRGMPVDDDGAIWDALAAAADLERQAMVALAEVDPR
jgi:hypothetical protein